MIVIVTFEINDKAPTTAGAYKGQDLKDTFCELLSRSIDQDPEVLSNEQRMWLYSNVRVI